MIRSYHCERKVGVLKVQAGPYGRLRGIDFAVVRFLNALDKALAETASDGSFHLLGLRYEFDLIMADRPRAGLRMWLSQNALQRPAAPIAIWLLGHCCTPYNTRRVDELVDQEMPASFARHFARALRRLEAWSTLEELAARFPNHLRVQRQAIFPERPKFEDRLSRFAKHLDHSQAALSRRPSSMPLWFSTEYWRGRKARSAATIRLALERIRRLVRESR